jgi:hypothetical protein
MEPASAAPPWIDADTCNPGYVMRSKHLMPRRGSKHAWQHTQDYWLEKEELPAIDLDGEEFVYGWVARIAYTGRGALPQPDHRGSDLVLSSSQLERTKNWI